MKKKIILGSIFAVVILIFLSFTNVVGIHTVDSNSDSVSYPLFSIRTKRAINEEQEFETGSYLGKGKELPILIPKRDSKKALFQDFIVRINQMDDKSFIKLVNNIITHLNQDDDSHNYNTRKIILTLNILRNNPKMGQDYIIAENNDYFKGFTSGCTIEDEWVPGCLFLMIADLLFIFAFLLLYVITLNTPTSQFYNTCQFTCQEPSFCLIGCGPE
jgi:hypothetical protein